MPPGIPWKTQLGISGCSHIMAYAGYLLPGQKRRRSVRQHCHPIHTKNKGDSRDSHHDCPFLVSYLDCADCVGVSRPIFWVGVRRNSYLIAHISIGVTNRHFSHWVESRRSGNLFIIMDITSMPFLKNVYKALTIARCGLRLVTAEKDLQPTKMILT